MYESFYGLREKPFSLLPDPSYLYLSDKHQMALSLLEYSFLNQAGFCVISGATGAGKTTLIRHLLNQFGNHVSVGLITNTHQSFGELLRWILMAFNLNYHTDSQPQLYQTFVNYLIEQYGKNRNTILIVDEAQNMSVETLEELRMLSNINTDKDQVLQIILVGQPGLRDKLRRPELEQFAQRIAVDYHLEPLNQEEAHNYIRHRLTVAGGDPEIFTKEANDAVYRYSGGTPRLINLLCESVLVYGYAEGVTRLPAKLVEDVARERQANGLFPRIAGLHMNAPAATPTTAAITAPIEPLLKRATARDGGSTGNAGAISSATARDGGSTGARPLEANAGAVSNATTRDGASAGAKHLETNAAAGPSASQGSVMGQSKTVERSVSAQRVQEQGSAASQGSAMDTAETTAQENHHHIDIDVEVEMKEPVPATIQLAAAGPARAGVISKLIHLDTWPRATGANPGQGSRHVTRTRVSPPPPEAIKAPSPDAGQEPGPAVSAEGAGAAPVDAITPAHRSAMYVSNSESVSTMNRRQAMPDANNVSRNQGRGNKWVMAGSVGFSIGLLAAVVVFSLVYFKSGVSLPALQAPMSVIMPPPASVPDPTASVSVSPESVAPAKQSMLEALQRERDAAIAQTKAMERERDAALAAAQAREQANAAALSAAQARAREKAATLEALKAQERARTAELEAIAARDRERAAALEAANVQMRKSQMETKLQADTTKSDTDTGAPVAKAVEPEPRVIEPAPAAQAPAASAAGASPVKFSANPCKGPSAKFLSTCKE